MGRAQELLYYLHLLKASGAIANNTPIYLNSPMAVDATAIFNHFKDEHRLTPEQSHALCHTAHIVNSVEESKRLNQTKGQMCIRDRDITSSSSGTTFGSILALA